MITVYKVFWAKRPKELERTKHRDLMSASVRNDKFMVKYLPEVWSENEAAPFFCYLDVGDAMVFQRWTQDHGRPAQLWECETKREPNRAFFICARWSNIPLFWQLWRQAFVTGPEKELSLLQLQHIALKSSNAYVTPTIRPIRQI